MIKIEIVESEKQPKHFHEQAMCDIYAQRIAADYFNYPAMWKIGKLQQTDCNCRHYHDTRAFIHCKYGIIYAFGRVL